MYKYNEIDREVVRRQWNHLLEGKEVDDTLVRPEVIELWQEAKSLGIDPITWHPEYLSKEAFDQRIAENRKIIDAAMPFLRNLYENIHFSYSLVVLADRERAEELNVKANAMLDEYCAKADAIYQAVLARLV